MNNKQNKYCIILAAGKNERLDQGIPKSLISIDGATLLERQIKLFESVGVNRFCIVVGYRSEMIVDKISEMSVSPQTTLETILNEKYDLENGYSLFSAKNWIEKHGADQFYFTMADHYFSTSFLKASIRILSLSDGDLLKLVVDAPGSTNSHIDLDDVTKVQSETGRIDQIGKSLTEYNYYDTGLFFASKLILETLESCIKEGRSSISNMVSKLCASNQAGITEVSGYFWNDVDTPEDLKTTLSLLAEKTEGR